MAGASARRFCRLEILRQRRVDTLNVASGHRDLGRCALDHLALLTLLKVVKFLWVELFLYFSVLYEL